MDGKLLFLMLCLYLVQDSQQKECIGGHRNNPTGRKYGYCWNWVRRWQKTKYTAPKKPDCKRLYGYPVYIDSKNKLEKFKEYIKEKARNAIKSPTIWLSDIKNQKWAVSNRPVSKEVTGLSYVPENHVCAYLEDGKVKTTSCEKEGVENYMVCEDRWPSGMLTPGEFAEIEPKTCKHAFYRRHKVTGEKYGYCWLVVGVKARRKYNRLYTAWICNKRHGKPVAIDSEEKRIRLRSFLQETAQAYKYDIIELALSELHHGIWQSTKQKMPEEVMKWPPRRLARECLTFTKHGHIIDRGCNKEKSLILCEED